MPTDITVPQLGESIVEATVGRWLKQVGEPVQQGEAVVELETDKVNLEVQVQVTGVLAAITKPEGETVGIGEVIGRITEGAAAAAPPAAPAPEPSAAVPQAAAPAAPAPTPVPTAMAPAAQAPPAPVETPAAAAAAASPEVRRLALDLGVDITTLSGTGPHGRISREDVIAAVRRTPAAPAVAAVTPQAQAAPSGAEQRVRMSRRRITIARRLVEAQHAAAMLTTFNEVDLSRIMEIRRAHKESFKEKYGVSLGLMSFFTRAAVSALKAFPRLNAELQGEEMVLKQHYDIGIAVSTPEGLVVPVLRGTDRMTFAEIEQGIAQLADRARKNTLTLEDLQGGTFTITNGGVFGSLLSTPILNAPQVGILGMHGIQERPVAVGGEVVIHPMMYVALSYDHRIVDGSESVRFLVHMKKLLEDPVQLMLEG